MRCYCVIVTAPGPGAGGGMSVYLQFLDALAQSFERQKCEEAWHIFVDDGMPMPSLPNVCYHVWCARGLGRLWFDVAGFNHIVKSEGIIPDVVFSLQNSTVRCPKARRHVIYFHQSLALYHYKMSLFEKKAKTYYFYHYLYPLYVKLYLNRNTYVAVQTETVRKCFLEKFNLPASRVGVFFPRIEMAKNLPDEHPWAFEEDTYNFLYPANPSPYKEHRTIAYALDRLYAKNPQMAQKVRIHFTAQAGSMAKLEQYLAAHGMTQNVVFHGIVSHEQLLSMLKSCHGLLFPSVIETIGLPLLESASLGIPIVANHLDYAHEVLEGYEGARFVPVHDYDAWAESILFLCSGFKRYAPYIRPHDDSWARLLKIIRED